jgi:hypothetical protein
MAAWRGTTAASPDQVLRPGESEPCRVWVRRQRISASRATFGSARLSHFWRLRLQWRLTGAETPLYVLASFPECCANDQSHHAARNRLRCRQDSAGGGALPAGGQSRHLRAPLQAAEHVEQRGRCRRWRRDRPGAMAAVDGGKGAIVRAHEPGAAKAAVGCRQPDHCPGQGMGAGQGARLPAAETALA